MDKIQVDPVTWQEKLGFAQGWKVSGANTLVFVAGQVPISAEGEVVGAGDFEAQVRQTFVNMGNVLEQAGASFADVVKLTAFFTDLGKLRDYSRVRDEFVNTAAPPASTAVEVSRLALPELMIEVEAIAVV